MSMLLAAMLWSSITARGIINPIVVAAPAGGDSALYFVLRNSSREEDRLLRVTCSCAGRIELMSARGGDPGLDTRSVAMPAGRLVELRPGGRHMVLGRLRRPLAAGGTVAMTFHYADGSETRDVRIVADAGEGWAAGLIGRGPRRLAALEGLAGWCWQSVNAGGRPTGTRCFSPAYGLFMQERQEATRADGALFLNYILYAHDVMGRTTGFRDNGPEGAQRAGRVVADEAGLLFEDYSVDAAGGISTRTSWRRDGPDAWLVRSEKRFQRGWREIWRIRMVRAGPSPPL